MYIHSETTTFFVTNIIQQHESFKWYFQDDHEEAFNLNIFLSSLTFIVIIYLQQVEERRSIFTHFKLIDKISIYKDTQETL